MVIRIYVDSGEKFSSPEREVWMKDAKCLDKDPQFFEQETRAGIAEAKKFCSGCLVRLDCLFRAIEDENESSNPSYFVRGGLSGKERNALRRKMKE